MDIHTDDSWLMDENGCIRDEHAKAYWAGYSAFHKGITYTSQEPDAWLAGWHDAADEADEEVP